MRFLDSDMICIAFVLDSRLGRQEKVFDIGIGHHQERRAGHMDPGGVSPLLPAVAAVFEGVIAEDLLLGERAPDHLLDFGILQLPVAGVLALDLAVRMEDDFALIVGNHQVAPHLGALGGHDLLGGRLSQFFILPQFGVIIQLPVFETQGQPFGHPFGLRFDGFLAVERQEILGNPGSGGNRLLGASLGIG